MEPPLVVIQMSELDSLQATMNEAINAVREEIKKNKLPALSNYAVEPHPLDKADYICPSRLYEARRCYAFSTATIGQLKNLLQQPYEKAVEQTCAVYETATQDILVQTGVLDRLAKSPGQGLDVQTLHKELDVDPEKLAVILRYAAVQGWLHEPREGTFALTRPALELLVGGNGWTWVMNPGKPKIAQALVKLIKHPEWRYSRKSDQAAFQIAHNTPLTGFAWLKQNPDVLILWQKAIQSIGDAYSSGYVTDVPWHIYDGWTVVDCGGGQGNLSLSLVEVSATFSLLYSFVLVSSSKAFYRLPQSRFIVQDLPEVMESANTNIAAALGAQNSGRVVFEPHNFFELQSQFGEKHVYLLRHILHDWPDQSCLSILKGITAVAPPSSRIVILDVVCRPNTVSLTNDPADSDAVRLDDLEDVAHHRALTAPAYIPANFGASAKMELGLNVHMLGMYNALERTMTEWETLLTKAGLRILRVHKLRGLASVIECEPAVPSV